MLKSLKTLDFKLHQEGNSKTFHWEPMINLRNQNTTHTQFFFCIKTKKKDHIAANEDIIFLKNQNFLHTLFFSSTVEAE